MTLRYRVRPWYAPLVLLRGAARGLVYLVVGFAVAPYVLVVGFLVVGFWLWVCFVIALVPAGIVRAICLYTTGSDLDPMPIASALTPVVAAAAVGIRVIAERDPFSGRAARRAVQRAASAPPTDRNVEARSAPPTDRNIEARSAPIEAFRGWIVDTTSRGGSPVGEPLLRSVTRSTMWQSAELTATCEVGGHSPPVEDCTCGIYAVKTGIDVSAYARQRSWVSGPVALSGKVIEGEIGYRAARARILGPLTLHRSPELVGVESGSLPDASDGASIAARLELRYGVTVNVEGDG